MKGQLFSIGAVKNDVQDLGLQVFDGGFQLKFVLFRQGVEVHPGNAVRLDVVPAGGGNTPLHDGQVPVWDNQVRVNFHLGTQPGTGGTGPEGVVEGEHPGGELLNGHTAVLAGVVLGEHDVPVLLHDVDDHQPPRQVGGHLHAVGEPPGDVIPDNQPVYHHLNVVLFVLIQLDLFAEVIEGTVCPYPDVARFPGVLKNFQMLSLFSPNYRGHHLDSGSLGQGKDLVNNLVNGLLFDLLAADGTVGSSYPGPQQTQVVVNFGDGAYGRPGIFRCGLLVDGDGRGETVDVVHIGLFHLA